MPFPTPVERQREVVCLPAKGHQVILGTAGSGKTTMAILRAAQLADPELPESGRVLLLTYNKALGSYIRSISDKRLSRVTVEHYHLFARGYLNSHGLMSYNCIINPRSRRDLIEAAVDAVRPAHKASAIFGKTTTFLEAEVAWIAKNGIDTLDTYLQAERIGRGEPLIESSRRIIWDIRYKYLEMRAEKGYKYDWDDIAVSMHQQLLKDNSSRFYRHIVIDEGQDLSPEMLRSIANAVPKDGSITFFGDVAQQIYGQRVSWRSAGLRPQKVWEFSENYRNSREIAALGLAIAKMDYYRDVVDMVAPKAPKAAGPKPTLVEIEPSTNEIKFVAEQAKALAKVRSVAILLRTVAQQNYFSGHLPRETVKLRDDNPTWVDTPTIYIGTYHSAKGLEFDAVILPFMSEASFPDPTQVEDFGQIEADANDGRLLYVGVTRAKTALIVTHKGPLSHLMPSDASLYTKVTR